MDGSNSSIHAEWHLGWLQARCHSLLYRLRFDTGNIGTLLKTIYEDKNFHTIISSQELPSTCPKARVKGKIFVIADNGYWENVSQDDFAWSFHPLTTALPLKSAISLTLPFCAPQLSPEQAATFAADLCLALCENCDLLTGAMNFLTRNHGTAILMILSLLTSRVPPTPTSAAQTGTGDTKDDRNSTTAPAGNSTLKRKRGVEEDGGGDGRDTREGGPPGFGSWSKAQRQEPRPSVSA